MDNGTVRLILQDDVLTAVLSGEIDHHTAQGMREEIDFTVNQSKPKKPDNLPLSYYLPNQ